MLQLIYFSTATAATPEIDMEALCREAARNNARDEITGVLLIRQHHFLQVLEGPRETVENTFLRIIVDSRHHSLRLLSRRMQTVRDFGAWSMALCDHAEEKQAVVDRIGAIAAHATADLLGAFDAIFRTDAGGHAADRPFTRSGTAPPA